MRALIPVFVGTAVACLASSSVGQSYRLSHVMIDEGSWCFTSVLRDDVTPKRVESIVAFLKSGVASGNNIVAVQYSRGASDGAAWTAQSWQSMSVEEAIKSVKASLQLPDEDDQWWPVGDIVAMNAISAPAAPTPYFGGLLVEDPLAGLVITSPARDVIVSALVEVGYAAANIDLESTAIAQQCDTKNVLTAMAKGAEAGLTTSDAAAILATASSYLAAQCSLAWCIPSTWYSAPGPWSSCVYGPWAFTGVCGPLTQPECCYACSCTKTQTRTAAHVTWDCSTTTWTQTNTITCTMTDSCMMAGVECHAPEPDAPCAAQFGGNGAVTSCTPPSGWLP